MDNLKLKDLRDTIKGMDLLLKHINRTKIATREEWLALEDDAETIVDLVNQLRR